MAALEEDLFEDLAYDEAEGVAAMEDELEMDDLAIDEFDEGYEDELEMEAYADEDYSDYDDAEDELEATEDYYDEFDSYDEFDEAGLDEAEDTFDSAMAFALGAEDADEFFSRFRKGLLSAIKKVKGAVRKAAPVVGRIARGVSRVASVIPHPYAQAIGRVAGIVGKGARLAQRLRMEGASEEEALEAFAEMAVRDPRALPLVAGLTARTVLKSKGARLSPAARMRAVKQMKGAANTLVRKRGPTAIRALPKIAKSVRRTAAVRGMPAATATKVVRRTASKVAASPALTRKLARPSPKAKRTVQMARVGGKGRSYVVQGPTRITISAA
jgi:hypothetical protein